MNQLTMLEQVLEFNRHFVENELYKPFITDRFPHKKVAILTCMDTRLVELLPAAIGNRNGDVKIIKTAGAIISHPYGSVMRSLLIAIYELGVESVWVIGHTECGMENLNVDRLVEKMKKRGISPETFDEISNSGIDFDRWLGGFESTCCAVLDSVEKIRKHPLIPKNIAVEGLLIDATTGKLTQIEKECNCK